MIEIAEMVNFTSLIREKAMSTFPADWKLLVHFLQETEKYECMICGFDDEETTTR